jgi:hypothetical protein
MIKLVNALLLPAMGCLVSASPAHHNPPCQRIDITDAAHPNRYHAALIFDSEGRVISCNEGFESLPVQVSYDAKGHINDVPGMVHAVYDTATGEIDELVVGGGDMVMDFTFVDNRVELAKLKVTDAGLSRTTNFVYAYGTTDERDADPVSVQWHYDEYKNGQHTESGDAKYLLTYSKDPFFVGSRNVISRMIYAYPPHAPVVSVHNRLVSRVQLTVTGHDLVRGRDVTLIKDENYGYTLDGVGRPVSMITTGTTNGRQEPPMTYNITYSCN